jgi:hypothetical protein
MFLYLLKKIFPIIALFFALTSLHSCISNSQNQNSTQRKNEVDSIVRKINDIDSLKTILSQYQVEGNIEGQMMSLKQLGKCQREQNKFVDATYSHTEGQKLAT